MNKCNKFCAEPLQRKLENFSERHFLTPSKQKGIPCSWIGRLNMIRVPILFKLIFSLNAIKPPERFL